MRYAIVSKGLTVSQLQDEVRRYGGRNLKVAPASKQVFCNLDDAGVVKLEAIPGLAVKKIGVVKTQQEVRAQQPIYAGSQVGLSSLFYQMRELVSPPVTGEGWTTVIMDSGIRKTHRGLVDKVVYEANFSTSPTCDDIFSHGTACAFQAGGGRHAAGEECGIAPGIDLMNIKVLGDVKGEASIESIVLAIEHVVGLVKDAQAKGLPPSDPMYPQNINMSFGTEDDGDPDNPLRIAVKEATKAPLGIFAAAGNAGPKPGSITLPASMPEVWGIGSITFVPFDVWQYSSRGPAPDGTIKPDMLFYGVDILAASSKDDEAFEMKSGTSFSSPSAAAGGGLLVQGMKRLGILPAEAVYSYLAPSEFLPFIALGCRKPSGTPAEKDNDYGVGQPFGDLIARMVTPAAAPLAAITDMVVPLVGVGMLGMMMAPIAKALR